MKKIERRAFVCLALALLLAAGLGFFLVKYFLDGGSWASSAFNRHLYNSSGQLASGTVLDRDGDVLSEVVDGQRTYYDNATVRKATLHAVGDLQGNIGTGALNAFADKLTGYSLLNGAFGAQRGNDLYLTIDARYNYTAYEALGGKSGTVAVYNYETGEILYMVSAPSYDPLNVPEDITTNDRYKGAYLNRFLSSTFTPGSVYKTVTLAAALEEIPDLADRTWTCSGSVQMGDETIICSGTHGEQDIASAFANSCNVAFAQIAQELGPGTLEKYTEQAGLTEYDGGTEHPLRPESRKRPRCPAGALRRTTAGHAAGAAGKAVPGPALRRAAAAHRAGPHPCRAAAHPDAGRALQRAGQLPARGCGKRSGQSAGRV